MRAGIFASSLALLFTPVVLWAQAIPMPEEELPPVRPIAPPVPVLPYPMWMIVTAGVLALVLVGLLVWGVIRFLRSRPGPPPPTAKEEALAALERLRREIEAVEPYPFSVSVSDVLRRYVTREYQLRATAQTSPEFLADVSGGSRFSEADRELLAGFLEKADLIKFARVHATSADSERLLEEALRFVKGGGAA